MEYIDLINRLIPEPEKVIVIQENGDLYLVDTSLKPKESDLVMLPDSSLKSYERKSMNGSTEGVVYAVIKFLAH